MGVRLPAEYQEVEYLEGVGAQYIDCPAPVGTVSIEAVFSANTQTATVLPFDVFGTYVREKISRLQISQQDENVLFVGFGSDYKGDIAGVIDDGTLHTATLSNDGAYLDGIKIWNTNQTVFNSTTPLHLFASYNLSRKTTGLQIRKIQYTSNGSNYILVPCYRKSDSKPGMYDLISGEFFTNAGTGEFLVGPDVIDIISPWLVAWRRMLMYKEPELYPIGTNILSYYQIVLAKNHIINIANGEYQEVAGYHASDFYIPISPDYIYQKNAFRLTGRGIAFYDKDKVFISGIQRNNLNIEEIPIPSNARYLRLGVNDSNTRISITRIA